MIELKEINKIYNNYNNNKVTALKEINLKLASTGLTFVAGPSGCGKSTLLNILSGVDIQTSGTMTVNGVNTENLGSQGFDGYRNNFVGIIHQDLLLLDHLSLGQNVALAMELKGMEPDAAQISELFKKLNIEGMENRYPNQCSIGQCQRAAIARTLIKKPQIIIADEPTSSVDPDTRIGVYSILRDLSKDALVIASTHNREMIDRFADRVIIMEGGRIISDTMTADNNSNIELFDQGKVVAVEPGTVLSSGDVDKVNEVIRKNNKKGVYLCLETDAGRVQEINPNAAKEIVQAALKEKQKTKDKQKKAKREELEKITTSGVFQFEKTKLPFKSAWKLSMVNFTSNKFRSVFTVILSFLAIMFFALTCNLARVNLNSLIISTFAGGSDNYITFESDSKLFNSKKNFGEDLVYDWTSDGKYDKSGLVYDFGKTIITNAPDYVCSSEPAAIYGVRKVIVDDTSSGNVNKFGIKLAAGSDGPAGRWPIYEEDNDSKSVVISDFIATQIQTAAYLHKKSLPEIDAASYVVPSFDDMTDKYSNNRRNKILIDGKEYTIIGIYETNFKDYFVLNADGYFKTSPEEANLFKPSMLLIKSTLTNNEKQRAEYLLQHDYVTAFVSSKFVSHGFLQGTLNNVYLLDNKTAGSSDYFITQHSAGSPKDKLYDGIKNAAGGFLFINDSAAALDNPLQPGTIKVNKQFYIDFIGQESDITGLTLNVDAKLAFNVAKNDYSYNILPDWSENDSGENVLSNSEVTYRYFVLNSFNFTISPELLDDNFGTEYSIRFAESNFEEVMRALVIPSNSFAVSGSYNAAALESIHKAMGKDVTPKFADSAIIEENVGSYTSLSSTMLTASIAYAIFVAALMYNYIFQSIRSKRKSIAVIRSMGAKTSDVFKIFVMEALMIAGLICLGAFITVGMAVIIGNGIIAKSTGIKLLVFNMNLIFLLILLAVTVLVICASYMVPVFMYARHNKNRGLARSINVQSDN